MSITFFAIPKSFKGNTAIHQGNSLKSLQLTNPGSQIVIYGQEEGIEEFCSKNGFLNRKITSFSSIGTPILKDVFDDIQMISEFDTVVYLNSDIIFLSDIKKIIQRIAFTQFLIIGKRTNVDINEIIDFSKENWYERLQFFAHEHGEQGSLSEIDYFIFQKGSLNDMPPFAVGRAGWDNWMIYHYKQELNFPVIDATDYLVALHQNHDYGHIKMGTGKKYEGAESDYNRKLIGKWSKFYSIIDADYQFTSSGDLERSPLTLKKIQDSIMRNYNRMAESLGFSKIT